MDQQPLDYNKHFTIPFVAFFQENNENNPKKYYVSRTIDGVYLQSLDKIQGGHDIFDLYTHRFITRQKLIEI